ncbi:MAG: glycosyl hydrolase [Lachnospiraceae bacterium]
MKRKTHRIKSIFMAAVFAVTTCFGGPVTQTYAKTQTETVALGKGSYASKVKGTYGDKTPNASLLEKLPYVGSTYRHTTETNDGPLQTSDWATSFAWDFDGKEPYSHSVYAIPLAYKASAEGMLVTMPSTVVDNVNNSYNMTMPENGTLTDFLIQPAFQSADAKVDKTTDWSYDIVMEDQTDASCFMKTTMVQGSPFAYVQLEKSDRISLVRKREGLPSALAGFNGASPETSTMLVFRVFDNQDDTKGYENFDYYALYVPEGTKLRIQKNGENIKDIEMVFPEGHAYCSFAALTSTKGVDDKAGNDVAAQYFPYAYNFITDTRADFSYDEKTQTVTTEYRYSFEKKAEAQADGTIMGILPHQYKNMKGAKFLPNTYRTIRGTMKMMIGDSYQTQLKYSGILPNMPTVEREDQKQLQTYVNEYMETHKEDLLGIENGDGDTYWTGKALNRVQNVLAAAETVGDTKAAKQLYQSLKDTLEDWFTTEDTEEKNYFYYDKGIGSLFGFPQSYNSVDQMNDHHFHYGYYIYAAAQVALRDPDWASDSNYGAMVKELIGDIACADRESTRYPYLRNFSPYEGHSWASGHQAFADGNNQESSSEALNAWAGILLFGEATGNHKLRDLGIYLYTTEISAVENYWFDVDADVLDDRYRYNVDTLDDLDRANTPVVRNQASMVWGGKYVYGTWWTAEPLQVQGINLLPMNPASFYLAKNADYIKENLRIALEREKSYTGTDKLADSKQRWNDIWSEYLALADPGEALSYWDRTATEESGESRAHTFHYIKGLQAFGTPDSSVSSDAGMSSVFVKNGEKTYVVYNPSVLEKKVTFSDGCSFVAGAKSWTIWNASGMQEISAPNYAENAPVTEPSVSTGTDEDMTPSKEPSVSQPTQAASTDTKPTGGTTPSWEPGASHPAETVIPETRIVSKDGRTVSCNGKQLCFTVSKEENVSEALVYYKLCDSRQEAETLASVAGIPGYRLSKTEDGTWEYKADVGTTNAVYVAVCFTTITDGKGTDTWLTLPIPKTEELPGDTEHVPSEKPAEIPSLKPTTSSSTPTISVSEPESVSSKPAESSSIPNISDSKPTVSGIVSKPTESSSRPTAAGSSSKPTASSSRPTTSGSEPTVSNSKPAETSSKPTTPGQESSYVSEESGSKTSGSIPTRPESFSGTEAATTSRPDSASEVEIESSSVPSNVPSTSSTAPSKDTGTPSTNTQKKQIKKIQVSPNTITLTRNQKKRIQPKISPKDSANPNITVTIADKKVASLTEVKQKSAVIKAKNPGITILTIKSVENPKVKTTVKIIVRPEKITGVKAKKVKKTSVQLYWNKQTGVTGYVVYEYQPKNCTYRKLKTTTNHTVTIKKRKSKTTYRFKVRAYKKTGKTIVYGAFSNVQKIKTQ